MNIEKSGLGRAASSAKTDPSVINARLSPGWAALLLLLRQTSASLSPLIGPGWAALLLLLRQLPGVEHIMGRPGWAALLLLLRLEGRILGSRRCPGWAALLLLLRQTPRNALLCGVYSAIQHGNSSKLPFRTG